MESIVAEIRSRVKALESDTALYDDASFGARAQALDVLEFDVIGRIEGLRLTDGWSEALTGLSQRAETVRGRLEAVDEGLFRELRQNIASGDFTSAELKQRFVKYAYGSSSGTRVPDEGYDSLDALVNGLLLTEAVPDGVRKREPEMVFYQPTPARVVLEMVENAAFRPGDVFYDIGSGLGQVSILVHLLGGVLAKGVEVEPVYCDYARRCAQRLNLCQVEFVNVDAREADYSDGTVFFLYTPFEGRMLERVLERLEDASRRGIRLYTYGPCTLQVTRKPWLERLDQYGSQVNRLASFRTVEPGLGPARPPRAPDGAGRAPRS